MAEQNGPKRILLVLYAFTRRTKDSYRIFCPTTNQKRPMTCAPHRSSTESVCSSFFSLIFQRRKIKAAAYVLGLLCGTTVAYTCCTYDGLAGMNPAKVADVVELIV